MKGFFYSVYALLFNLSARLFPLKEKRAAFVSMHNEDFCDSLGQVMAECQKCGIECVSITRTDLNAKNPFRLFRFFFFKSNALARSKYVFLNDNFMPMSRMNFKKGAVVTQLWHGEGAFKRFGLAIEQPKKLRENEIEANKRLSYVICSSRSVAAIYAEAFGVDESKVLPLGSPRADYLLNEENRKKAREKLQGLYPSLKNKKLVLYAPTFRGTKRENEQLLSHFDFELFEREMGETHALLLRLHPQVHESLKVPSSVIDVTNFSDVRELVLACDELITDYSSICMLFSLLKKKTVFFAFDKEDYIKERDFYFDYNTCLPGEIALTTAEVIEGLKADFDEEKNNRFLSSNFDFVDTENTKRVLEFLKIN